jgi:hypothetical protein
MRLRLYLNAAAGLVAVLGLLCHSSLLWPFACFFLLLVPALLPNSKAQTAADYRLLSARAAREAFTFLAVVYAVLLALCAYVSSRQDYMEIVPFDSILMIVITLLVIALGLAFAVYAVSLTIRVLAYKKEPAA